MKDFTPTGNTAMERYSKNGRCNTFDEFREFCEFHKVTLNTAQASIAKELFKIPSAGGKSMLIALLFGYDLASQVIEETEFTFRNPCLPEVAASCLQDIQSLAGKLLHEYGRS